MTPNELNGKYELNLKRVDESDADITAALTEEEETEIIEEKVKNDIRNFKHYEALVEFCDAEIARLRRLKKAYQSKMIRIQRYYTEPEK